MRKIIIVAIIFLSIFTIAPGYAWYFDKEPSDITLMENVEYAHVKITTIGTASGLVPEYNGHDVTWHKKIGTYLLEGVGFIIDNRYIITAAHVVYPSFVTLAKERNYYYERPTIEVSSGYIMVTDDTNLREIGHGGVPATIYYLDVVNDVAILKFDPTNIYLSVPYELAKTQAYDNYTPGLYSLLCTGDSIAIIVRKRDEYEDWDWGFEVRYGKITSPTIIGVDTDDFPAFNMNTFSMDLKVYGGDSGSAIFAFKDGEPIIVGVLTATNQGPWWYPINVSYEYTSYATRIDPVKEIIEAEKY